jgi:hypothetical protein
MKTGRKVVFHGAFTSKRKAVTKERKVGGFIRRAKVNGSTRYIVMTHKKG